jgi:hypothetical protein
MNAMRHGCLCLTAIHWCVRLRCSRDRHQTDGFASRACQRGFEGSMASASSSRGARSVEA